MSSTTPCRADNTSSEVLLGALPALLRTVEQDPSHKATMFRLCHLWFTPLESRRPDRILDVHEAEAHNFLEASIKNAEKSEEADCVKTIFVRGYAKFAPADFLFGSV